MALKIFKEQLNGKYDGDSSPLLLPPGSIADGKNVRKVSGLGGWKPRRGCDHHNTTQLESGAAIKSLHDYTHPRNADNNFIAQVNSKLFNATTYPDGSTTGTTFGSDISNGNTIDATTAGFSDTIQEMWVYADSNKPLMWGGSNPYCTGFIVNDNSESADIDYTRLVTDNRSDTEAIVLGAANDVYYVCSSEIAKGITLDIGSTVNAAVETLTLKSWQSGAWSDRSATDGTLSGGATHAIDGSITWTASSSDTMRVIGGIMGYWYQVSFSGALTGSVDVISCKVQFDLATMTNKWDGIHEKPLSVRWFDDTANQYIDLSGKLSNESTSQYHNISGNIISDAWFIKSKEPLTGIGFGVADGYENTTAAKNIDTIKYWDGDSWNSITTGITDETLDTGGAISYSQSGTVWWNATGLTIAKRTMPFDSTAGYWYQVDMDAGIDNAASDVRVYFVTVALFPESLPAYDGVIEFKGRAMLWGDPEFPNRLRYSCKDRPDCFSGTDSGYTDSFGDMTKIVAVKRFYNELIIWKANSVWLLEGYSPDTFGILRIADTVGCDAPHTAQVMELGSAQMHANERLSIALWKDTDGVYALDGRKPRKISGEVDHYFNTEYSTAIAATVLSTCHAGLDLINNEYHLIVPGTGTGHGTELVYNVEMGEWYPPWDRTVGGANDYITCWLSLRGSDNRYYTYAGNNVGRTLWLEIDTADRNASDADIAIDHSIKTRAISAQQTQSSTLNFTARKIQVEVKAQSAGTITTKTYKNLATSGTTLATPATMTMVSAGFNATNDYLDASIENCFSIQYEFQVNTIDWEMEIYSFIYGLDSRGEIGV